MGKNTSLRLCELLVMLPESEVNEAMLLFQGELNRRLTIEEIIQVNLFWGVRVASKIGDNKYYLLKFCKTLAQSVSEFYRTIRPDDYRLPKCKAALNNENMQDAIDISAAIRHDLLLSHDYAPTWRKQSDSKTMQVYAAKCAVDALHYVAYDNLTLAVIATLNAVFDAHYFTTMSNGETFDPGALEESLKLQLLESL